VIRKFIALFLLVFSFCSSVEAEEQRLFTVDYLTKEDEKIIEYFIGEMSLRSMEQMRDLDRENKENFKRFRRINPLLLLNFITSNKELYHCTRKILQEEKKAKFLTAVLSMEIGMARKEGVLSLHISNFSSALCLDSQLMQGYIDRREYKELIFYMFRL
jgi:hypothetical protein